MMDRPGDIELDLSAEDRRLLDELSEVGFDPRVLDGYPPDQRRRAERLLDLLGLLRDYPVEDGDEALVQATMDRVEQIGSAVHGGLSPEDRRILDTLAESGFAPEAVESLAAVDRARAEKVMGLLRLLDEYPVEPADETLVHATLALIDRHESDRGRRMTIDPQEVEAVRSRQRRRLPIPNFVSAAAAILICASVVLPILNSLRQQQLEHKTQDNLRYVTRAVNSYASDFNGTIPAARAGLTETVWSAFADAINLTPMVEHNYCRLNAPKDEDAAAKWQARVNDWQQSNLILFMGADNPVLDAIREGRRDARLSITLSEDPGRRNLLSQDSAILWLRQPRTAPDSSFWRPRGVQALRDDIHPDDPGR